jgi:hypothetical protein
MGENRKFEHRGSTTAMKIIIMALKKQLFNF